MIWLLITTGTVIKNAFFYFAFLTNTLCFYCLQVVDGVSGLPAFWSLTKLEFKSGQDHKQQGTVCGSYMVVTCRRDAGLELSSV